MNRRDAESRERAEAVIRAAQLARANYIARMEIWVGSALSGVLTVGMGAFAWLWRRKRKAAQTRTITPGDRVEPPVDPLNPTALLNPDPARDPRSFISGAEITAIEAFVAASGGKLAMASATDGNRYANIMDFKSRYIVDAKTGEMLVQVNAAGVHVINPQATQVAQEVANRLYHTPAAQPVVPGYVVSKKGTQTTVTVSKNATADDIVRAAKAVLGLHKMNIIPLIYYASDAQKALMRYAYDRLKDADNPAGVTVGAPTLGVSGVATTTTDMFTPTNLGKISAYVDDYFYDPKRNGHGFVQRLRRSYAVDHGNSPAGGNKVEIVTNNRAKEKVMTIEPNRITVHAQNDPQAIAHAINLFVAQHGHNIATTGASDKFKEQLFAVAGRMNFGDTPITIDGKVVEFTGGRREPTVGRGRSSLFAPEPARPTTPGAAAGGGSSPAPQ